MYDDQGLLLAEKYINEMGEEDLLDYDDSEFPDGDGTESNDPPDQTGQAEGNTTNEKSNDGHSNDREEGELSESEETTPESGGKSKTRSAKKSQNVTAKSLTKSLGEDLPLAKPNPKAKVSNTGKGPVGGTTVKKPFPKIQRRVPTKSELQLKKLKDNYLHFTNDLKQQMRRADASYAKSVATLTYYHL